MIKLNGKFYLRYCEVEREIHNVARKFRTSQRAVLPQQVTYLDREFVQALQDEAKNLILFCSYLFGNDEEYCSSTQVIQCAHDRLRNEEHCTNQLRFMQYDLSDSQREKYRNLYLNHLINVFLDECIKDFEKLS